MSEKLFRAMSNEVKQWYCIESVEGEMFSIQEVVDLLNEQQATIIELNKQIEQLNLAIDDLLTHTSCDEIKKQNKQLRTQLLQQSNDDGRFQVWEVPPIPKGKRISFTTYDNGDGV